uniref:serine/threonine-protein phosphatase PGAM5, mitochondrial isoform X2 n=1 Tax=Scatophagus argus TaxID=75038 RepID=UPI001ED856C8|nr:serine/threonine-protein phosphatase PGAM5, mitochondrial isoform X2 [Scatophagus argus]
MSYRKSLKLICGFAGGSAVLVLAAAAADSRRYFGEQRGEVSSRWSRFNVLQAAQPAWTPASHTPAPSGHSWDFNWDKRDPSALSNGKKKETATEDPSSEQDNGKPKATRNILLIRHSQYNLSGNSDKERILTPLGREQADLTGKRLAALGLKYDVLIHSSMARATETAHIISKHLPGVELLSCDLLREGAPIEPVPPVTHWKPDAVGSAVSSRRLVTYGLEQRQHHMAHHPPEWKGGPQSFGRCRIHASGQTNTDLMAQHTTVPGTQSSAQLVGRGAKLSFLLKCPEKYCCYYFVIELPSCKERLCGRGCFCVIKCQQRPVRATPPECNRIFTEKTVVFV